MKLIFCPKCWDVVKLDTEERACKCGMCVGRYEDDGLHATVNAASIPFGINNQSFTDAVQVRPVRGLGVTFEAFVIPKECDTVKVVTGRHLT